MNLVAILVAAFNLLASWFTIEPPPSKPPNILFILADDLGWNDVGWHNARVKTPHLKRLAHEGSLLDKYYVQPVCSPSRAALLSGLYPFHTGMQHGALPDGAPIGLPLDLTLLPQKLKELGYATHIVGKWHLGNCHDKYTPTWRGFDSFLGFLLGSQDHYSHRKYINRTGGLDFWQTEGKRLTALVSENNTYSTEVFKRRTLSLLEEHNRTHPFFIYLPFQAVHAPLQVPKRFAYYYQSILSADQDRKTFLGMVTAMDEAIGEIVTRLKKLGYYDNTIIVFTSDNGGPVQLGANNFPLRGSKNTVWEGGTRAVGLIRGPGIGSSKYSNLMHVVDWFPTLIDAAGGTLNMSLDGRSHWPALQGKDAAPRDSFVYQMNMRHSDKRRDAVAAIRFNHWKLIDGYPGQLNGWYASPESGHPSSSNWTETVNSPHPMLFNIDDDPYEEHDVSAQNPVVVEQLLEMLSQEKASEKDALNRPGLERPERARATHWGDKWAPGWC